MKTEYRLTADGALLDPATADPAEYASAKRRWIVATLPSDKTRRRTEQVDAMLECGILDGVGGSARSLADAVLHHPTASAVVPDDVVALRIGLATMTERSNAVKVSRVHLVARVDRAVTTSIDEASLQRLVQRVRELPRQRRRGGFVVARALLSLALEDATAVADRVTVRTSELEDSVFTSTEPDDDVVADIYRIKRSVAEMRRHLLPVINRLALITEVDDAELGEDAVTHMERIEAAFRRVADGLDTDDRLLGDMLTAQLTLVQVQQNSDMRKISAYAALITVPTLIAGIYGMNFREMPELGWWYGYPFALALMVITVLLLRIGFKRSGWL